MMPSGFDTVSVRVREPVGDCRVNEEFHFPPAHQDAKARRTFKGAFWRVFAWDADHKSQKNPFKQEGKAEGRDDGFSPGRADHALYFTPY
jgi:hypothetical protein